MKHKFDKGDHVQGKGTGRKGRVVDPCRTDIPFGGLVEVAWDHGGRSAIGPESLELVPYKPSWFEVTIGCTVDFTYEGAPFAVDVKSMDEEDGYPLVLGRSTPEWTHDTNARLVSITKPTPPLPTKPGVALKVVGVEGLVHRRLEVTSSTYPWVADSGVGVSDEFIQGRGWEVAS